MQQRVDPFIPVQHKRPAPQGQYGSQWLRKPEPAAVPPQPRPLPPKPVIAPAVGAQPARVRPIDGILASPRPPAPPRPAIQPERFKTKPQSFDIIRRPAPAAPRTPDVPRSTPRAVVPTIAAKLPVAAKPHVLQKLSFLSKAQLPVIILGAITAGLAIQLLAIGELIIGAYAVFALVRRVPSRTSFTLALVALLTVVALLAIRGDNSALAQNFAVYAFLLLVVGTVSLALEMRRQPA